MLLTRFYNRLTSYRELENEKANLNYIESRIKNVVTFFTLCENRYTEKDITSILAKNMYRKVEEYIPQIKMDVVDSIIEKKCKWYMWRKSINHAYPFFDRVLFSDRPVMNLESLTDIITHEYGIQTFQNLLYQEKLKSLGIIVSEKEIYSIFCHLEKAKLVENQLTGIIEKELQLLRTEGNEIEFVRGSLI